MPMKRYSKRSYGSSKRSSRRATVEPRMKASLRGRSVSGPGRQSRGPSKNISPRVQNYFNSMGGSNVAKTLYKARTQRSGEMTRMRTAGTQGKAISRRSSSQDVQYGMTGRGGKSLQVPSYKILSDVLFPVLRERIEAYGFTAGSMESLVGAQAYDLQSFFSQGQLQGWYAKSLDAQNISNTTFIGVGAQVDWVFQYLGGSITYTITNTCSHTMQLDMLQVISKRYQNIDPVTRWDVDLSADNTIRNAQAPIEVFPETRNSLNCRPGQGGRNENSFRMYYQKLGNKRYTLEPGQTVYHTIVFPAFRMTGKQINTEISGGVGAAQNTKTQFCMAFTRGLGLVCDGADADVNVGATACVITGIQKHSYRASFVGKPYQTYNVNLLPQAAAFASQQEINVETEAIEGYSATK